MMMKRIAALALLVGLSIPLGGCGAKVLGLSSHTVATGPDQQSDVVWVMVNGVPTRCAPTAQGPVCKRARVQ